jgi:hypothetical protein
MWKQSLSVLRRNTDVQGNAQAYLLARLKRDAPGILARVEAGEFPSARAAAKAAGIVREPTHNPLQTLVDPPGMMPQIAGLLF